MVWQYILVYIIALNNQKKVSLNQLARSQTNGMYTHSWETTTKITFPKQYYNLMVGNSNGNLNHCIVSFIECKPVSLLRIQKELPKPPQSV